MSRKEFILRACISMAGRVIGKNGITDSDDWENMVNEAEKLACVLEKEGYNTWAKQ